MGRGGTDEDGGNDITHFFFTWWCECVRKAGGTADLPVRTKLSIVLVFFLKGALPETND